MVKAFLFLKMHSCDEFNVLEEINYEFRKYQTNT